MMGDQGSMTVRDRKKGSSSLCSSCATAWNTVFSDGLAAQAPWVPDIFQAVSEITGPGAIGAVEAETIGDT
jgi:hypothetical protein